MQYRLGIAIIFLGIILFFTGALVIHDNKFLAALIFPESITPEELKEKYQNKNFKILIVPGHDNESKSGSQFEGIREKNLNLELASELFELFNADSHFEVFLTRDESGYRNEFSRYFSEDRSQIVSFRDQLLKAMNDFFKKELVEKRIPIEHNFASEEDSVKLYGINRWANEKEIDLVIHVHFNDDPTSSWNQLGQFTGFSIYIPESQLPNGRASKEISKKVFSELAKILSPSDHPQERIGIIEEQELIAIGSNASLNSAALLIEYGYIYESQFRNEKMRNYLFPEMAHQTYAGIKKFFEPDYKINQYDSRLLPHRWDNNLFFGMKNAADVAALQMALKLEGVYNEAITGNFFEHTRKGVIDFQRKYKFDPPYTGYVGPQTRKVLNERYSK